MSEPANTASPADPKPKAPRRRFTPDERIARAQAEIARVEEDRRTRVRETINSIASALRDCAVEANKAGLKTEAKRCTDALAALLGGASVDGMETE